LNESLTFHPVARRDELEPDYPLRVRLGMYDLAIYLFDGEVYATDNICTHAYASLADGLVDGDTVECPLHGACFNFRTGRALTEPATVNLRTYPVRVEEGNVLIGLPARVAAS
jgi:nitrite reductase/ring-hydroxylating ferredoxin subunit